MSEPSITIPLRFRGPPDSANGGYASGAAAQLLGDGPVEITLVKPPPLETPLVGRATEDGLDFYSDDDLIIRARPSGGTMPAGKRATLAEAEAATACSPFADNADYATCFTCGSGRAVGDGLRLWSGPVAGHDRWAVPWVPDRSVADEDGLVLSPVVWAALDCPTLGPAADPARGPAVLGRLEGRQHERVRLGEAYVITSWAVGSEGRKLYAEAALSDNHDEVLAWTRATWFYIQRPDATQ